MENTMIDIHMHIVPGVDDGSSGFLESEKMLREAYRQGIRTVFATPHSSAFDTAADKVYQRFAKLEEKEQMPLFLGCEMLVFPDTVISCLRKLDRGQYPAMGHSRCVLTEFLPFGYTQQDAEKCITEIVAADYIPIIAHAERYQFTSVDGIKRLKDLGALVQINAYSIANEQNMQIREKTDAFLKEQLADFLGSDAHRMDHRPLSVEDGVKALAMRYEKEYVEKITVLNAKGHLGIPDCF